MSAAPEKKEINKTLDSNLDQLICFCHGVPESEIRKAILEGADTIEKIQHKTLASTGCGGCGCELERLLAEILHK